MTIWVDADAVPRPCREILFRAAQSRAVDVILVANSAQPVPGGRITAVQVPGGADIADDYIAARCGPRDLVITADIPLAARAVDRGASVITPRGRPLDAETVSEALSLRDFHDDLRSSGLITGGPPPYDAKAKQLFANALDRWITHHA